MKKGQTEIAVISILAILAIVALFGLGLFPKEIAFTGAKICPNKPVTLAEWSFPSVWNKNDPNYPAICKTNPNADFQGSVTVQVTTDQPICTQLANGDISCHSGAGTIIKEISSGPITLNCQTGKKIMDLVFTPGNWSTTTVASIVVNGYYFGPAGQFYHYQQSYSGDSSSCNVCTQGQTMCQGDYLLTCTSDQIYNIGGYQCEFGCTGSAGSAKCVTRTPNGIHCKDVSTYEQYTSDGTHIAKTIGCTTGYSCVENQGCVKATTNPTVCTQEAKQCPDGSYVTRDSNNNCQFKDCPTAAQSQVGCAYKNPNCTAIQDCVDNICVLKSGCLFSNPDCPTGTTCSSSGQCANSTTNSTQNLTGCQYSNPACPKGYWCDNSTCKVVTQETGGTYGGFTTDQIAIGGLVLIVAVMFMYLIFGRK